MKIDVDRADPINPMSDMLAAVSDYFYKLSFLA